MSSLAFSRNEQKILTDIAVLGVKHAATALSQLTNKKITIEAPQVSIVPLTEVPDIIGGPEQVVAGLYLKFLGGARGTIFLVFPEKSALNLIFLLGKEKMGAQATLTEMGSSILKEVGNILASSFLTAISKVTNLILIPSVPALSFDMAGAVVDSALIELMREEDRGFLVKTRFVDPSQKLTGHFFLIPDPSSLSLILEILGKKGR